MINLLFFVRFVTSVRVNIPLSRMLTMCHSTSNRIDPYGTLMSLVYQIKPIPMEMHYVRNLKIFCMMLLTAPIK